jgi:hypothetical protein
MPGDGVICLAQGLERNGAVKMRGQVTVIDRQRLVEIGDRRSVLPLDGRDDAEVLERRRVLRMKGEDLVIGGGGRIEPAGFMKPHRLCREVPKVVPSVLHRSGRFSNCIQKPWLR